ncbi:hypothetical protein DEFDS_1088 [Deferribacter desulfuricans SSM1]|uniref:Leucine rich repeat variant n=1 Tax=Deferribacter desulfuricans (strain DSM 14783 / JCM 11476 / NBRC 101012 / SSM1) TaxID=639282 RepID=D3PD84_DEFDS|nr:hypothetical protein [Deferribacter desulfuricans]BAI80557.1 hypothetical protein DEFDS_1088 [Deferribacter desulfuricans SSM1]
MVNDKFDLLINHLKNANLESKDGLLLFLKSLKLPYNEVFYDIYKDKKFLGNIELDIYSKKSNINQINLILEKSIPVDFKRLPIIIFLILKNYPELIEKVVLYFNSFSYDIKRDILKNFLFDENILIKFSKLLLNDTDFIKLLVELKKLTKKIAHILSCSTEPEVLFYLSNYDEIIKHDVVLVSKLLKNPYTPDESIVRLKQLLFELKEKEVSKDKAENEAQEKEETENESKDNLFIALDKFEEKVDEKIEESLYSRILKMSVPEKIKLALKGNKSARNILIKDSNKQIALSVLKNPRITMEEIDMVTKNKTTPDFILREIARSNSWIKDYQIIKNLVFNPKTPLDVSIHFINRLYLKDLEYLSKSKEVPNVVQAQAYRLVQQKNKMKK